MKNKKILMLVLLLVLFSPKVYAQDICSKSGYTVLSVNGIFTDENGAQTNALALKRKLSPSYNNQPVFVDYVYNATHLGGVLDLVDAVRQGLFDSKSDYDLTEMLNSASEKITTQKVLLVGHSQGNFYANNFYDKVVDKRGGIPEKSIGVYAVATPDDHVSGNGKYLTSDTDIVISTIVSRFKNIMTPNTHIDLQKLDGNGHSFSDVYLKYRSGKIVSDIKSSLDKLKANTIQKAGVPCISRPKISLWHEFLKVGTTKTDFIVNSAIKAVSFVYNNVNKTLDSLDNSLAKLMNKNTASVGLADNLEKSGSTEETKLIQDDSLKIEEQITVNLPKNIATAEKVIAKTEIDNPIVNTPIQYDDSTLVIVPESTPEKEVVSSHHHNNSSSDEEVVVAPDPVVPEVVTPVVVPDEPEVITPPVVVDPVVTPDEPEVVIPPVFVIPPDDDAPIITLIGESVINIELKGVYVESGATAIDEKDGVLTVTNSGIVDTANLGTYVVKYTAIDSDMNESFLLRTVNVINSNPVASKTAKLSFPVSGDYKDDGLGAASAGGKKDFTVFDFQVIFTDRNNNAPSGVKLHIYDENKEIFLPDTTMVQVEKGEDILSDGNYANGELFTFSSMYDTGYYLYSFTAFDNNGNFSKIEEDGSKMYFDVTPFEYFYIPKYTFGENNGDENDWQVWLFDGSDVYGWSDTYMNKYLHEEFTIDTYKGGYWCISCLERGIFKRDPRIGFDSHDVVKSQLDSNPQNARIDNTYHVVIQWDAEGYTTTVYDGSVLLYTAHFDVVGMNNDLWVGWDTSRNGFTRFPSGSWVGAPFDSRNGLAGGYNMILTPYPVYDINAEDTTPEQLLIRSSEKSITSFDFNDLDPKIIGEIDDTNHTVTLTVPYGTDVTTLNPTISVSEKANISPLSLVIKDFTNPVSYTVKAEDKTTESYVVTVIVSDYVPPVVVDEEEPLPIITSYTLNGNQSDITIDPTVNNLEIVLNANKNVEWKSLSVENEDKSLFKSFRQGEGCLDGTSVCKKIWVGDLSSEDKVLRDGNYKINVHIQDMAGKEYEEYLPSVITVAR